MSTPGIVLAEELRWRSSVPQKLLILVILFSLLSTVMFFGSGLEMSWTSTLAWNNLWVVGLGPTFAALVPTALVRMENRTRSGGTKWLGLDAGQERVVRMGVILVHLFLANLIAFAFPLLAGSVLGVEGSAPWGTAIALMITCTAGQSVVAAIALRLADATRPVIGLVAGLVWAFSWIVVQTVESPTWYWMPGNWVIQGSLPLLGTNANGTALDPGSYLGTASAWPATVLSIFLAVLLTVVAVPRAVRPVHNMPATTAPPARRAAPAGAERTAPLAHAEQSPARTAQLPARATHGSARISSALFSAIGAWRFIVPALGAITLTVLATRWRPVGDIDTFLGLIVIPFFATLLPVQLWSLFSPIWRVIAARPTRSLRPMSAMVAGEITVVVISTLAALAALAAGFGLPIDAAVTTFIACAACACIVVPVMTAAAVYFGTAAATGVGFIALLFGLLTGTGPLHDALWYAAPWGWGNLDSTWRIGEAVVAAVLIGPLMTVVASRRALRRASVVSSEE